ncbi:Lrp/AsnC ligand binding domain-containing protein [Streptomyces sp. NPDC001793]|uniref:Lrp/AsnC ligand binding domain-containing protein n=1 Tax=Streptomyces sp. NPDC001793 TaxID=3154657 RepID=UPI00332A362A
MSGIGAPPLGNEAAGQETRGEQAERGREQLVDVEVYATDRETVEEFEKTVAAYEEVVELRRFFGRPDYFLRVTVADHSAYEAFLTRKLTGLRGVLRVESHLTMKKIKIEL